MAHDIHMKNGKASMAYVAGSATPWHGLGNELPVNATMDDWVRAAGADWEIWNATVAYRARNPEQPDIKALSTVHTFPERKVLYRSDTGIPLATVSTRYKAVQPRQVVEFFEDLCTDQGWSMETAGVLGKGETFWALAKVGATADLGRNGGEDLTSLYMLITSSADGTGATKVRGTSIRVVCRNTLNMAFGSADGGRSASVPHSRTFDADAIKRQLGLIDLEKSWADFREEMQALQETPITRRQAELVFSELLRPSDDGLDLAALSPDDEKDALRLLQGPVGSRKIRGLDSMQASYVNAPGAQPGTAYGALQAVTHYVDHGANGASSARVKSSLTGAGERMKERARDILRTAAAA